MDYHEGIMLLANSAVGAEQDAMSYLDIHSKEEEMASSDDREEGDYVIDTENEEDPSAAEDVESEKTAPPSAGDEELDDELDMSTFDAHSWALDHLKVEIKDDVKEHETIDELEEWKGNEGPFSSPIQPEQNEAFIRSEDDGGTSSDKVPEQQEPPRNFTILRLNKAGSLPNFPMMEVNKFKYDRGLFPFVISKHCSGKHTNCLYDYRA